MPKRRSSPNARRERNDHEKLELFVRRVDEIGQTNLAQHGVRLSFNIHFSPHGSYIETEQPNEDEVRSFLLNFRQLISDKEDVCIRRIHNICERRLIPQEAKQHIRNARDAWLLALAQRCHTLTVAGRTRTPDDVRDLWINGHYFHNDVDLQDQLDRLNTLQKDLLWRLFVIYVALTSSYIAIVGEVVVKGLYEGWFNFEA